MESIINGLISIFTSPSLYVGLVILYTLKKGIHFVPQNRAYIVERFGKYNRTLTAGLNFVVPYIESVAHDRNLKEQMHPVPSQSTITSDNITVAIDGVLFVKVTDPRLATYGVDDYKRAAVNLAMTSMRSAIGKMELDKCFSDRDTINAKVQEAMTEATGPWGVQVLRYEIKDITPPNSVMEDMEKQMSAERQKRAAILESEGLKTAAINQAEGDKASRVLAVEAERAEQELAAEGEAKAITTVADATAKALKTVGDAAASEEGQKAIMFKLAEGAIEAQKELAKPSKGNVIMTSGAGTDAISEMVAKVVAIGEQVTNTVSNTSEKAYQSNVDESKDSSDMVGLQVPVASEISKTNGSIRYSGFNWKARIDDKYDAKSISEGEYVIITAVEGTTMLVKPVN